MKRIQALSVGLLLSLLQAACSDKVAMNDCMDRGLEYYKEIGANTVVIAYPHTGRLIGDVVQERCMRSTAAF